jgi:hypothetical protein
MTLDSFIKFQLRRNALDSAGVEPLRKNLSKILNKSQNSFNETELQNIFDESKRYIAIMSRRNEYSNYPEDLSNAVLSNADAVFNEIIIEMFKSSS